MKKGIIVTIIGIVVVAIIITAIFFIMNRTDVNNSNTQNTNNVITNISSTNTAVTNNSAENTNKLITNTNSTNATVTNSSAKSPEKDTDNDGLTDMEEATYGTDINITDTDGDGYLDGAEVEDGYNPNGTGKLELEETTTATSYIECAINDNACFRLYTKTCTPAKVTNGEQGIALIESRIEGFNGDNCVFRMTLIQGSDSFVGKEMVCLIPSDNLQIEDLSTFMDEHKDELCSGPLLEVM